MIHAGFLDPESRKDLTGLARDGSAAHRPARRANALVLPGDGMSYTAVANVLLIDDGTVRTWHRLSGKRLIHLFLDNARYHHAKLVQAWLARPGCRIKLHFVPAYCPHLNPIERLWGLMHKHVTHNRCYQRFAGFRDAMLTFLREEVPRNWDVYFDTVSDNFRIISP